MKKEYSIILSALLIILITAGVVFFYTSQDSSKTKNSNLNNPTVSVTGNSVVSNPDNANSISQTELSQHNSKSDCWVSYQGKVYDITAFLPKHPGSADAIAPYCGTSSQFENAFTNKHGTSKVSVLIKEGIPKGDFK